MRGGRLMNDLVSSGDPAEGSAAGIDDVHVDGNSAVQSTAGGLLRLAREAAGLHIAALAVALKVPVKKLEALEADRFDLLPDAVFVRALASSVCRTLKIDAGPVLQLLPQSSSPKLTYQGVGINTPFRAPSDGPGPSVWAQVSRPAVLAGMALLLAALVLIMMPALRQGTAETVSAVEAAPKGSAAVPKTGESPVVAENREEVPKIPDIARDSSLPADPPVAALVPASPSFQAASMPAAPFSAIPLIKPPAAGPSQVLVVPVVAAASSATASPSSSGIVVFTAKSESWVEVTDSKGQVVLRRILGAGEVAGASGVLPLAAIVGRADATQVQIRGRAFDLSAVAKDNVARFEVK